MLVKNAANTHLFQAMAIVNKKYGNNITWNREPEPHGSQLRCTLKVKSSKGSGAKVSYSSYHKPRRTIAACWHVHGDFFDALLGIQPGAIITTHTNKGITKIYADATGDVIDNWQDWNVGSYAYPVFFNESCECNS